jgi:dihydrofolate reductase
VNLDGSIWHGRGDLKLDPRQGIMGGAGIMAAFLDAGEIDTLRILMIPKLIG